MEYTEEHTKDDQRAIQELLGENNVLKKSKVITNSTPIIGLSIIGQLKLLAELIWTSVCP